MTSIHIKGSANMAQVQAQFAAVTAQVKAMNAELAKSAMVPQGGSRAGFDRVARGAQEATRAYNSALAASGAYRVEQMRINSATQKSTELLERHKMGFREAFGPKNRSMMRAVYREQLAMQQAVMRTTQGTINDGKMRMSLGIPTEVHQSWDTLNNRVGFFRTRLASASAELVNWGKNTQWAGRQLMAGISMPVAAFGAAAGYMAYQVDKQMTRIAKVYDTVADQNSVNIEEQKKAEAELAKLREDGLKTATNAAHAYGASVTDTLEVQAELAATGQTGLRLQESTNEVMRIATLGEIEHADATKALISLQSVLGHTVKQTADDFNYMNSIENATSLSTNDFVAAIPRALGPMKEMGGELKDLAILMVAMKERGIEAGEGANAIKAMMQRLYRPSAQVRSEWQQIAGVDPFQFVEESGGNVMEILPKIAEATRDLGRAERVKLLAGLFGTYQVTRMSAMLKGLDDMANGVGQVSRVMEVNQQTAEQWANTATQELAKQAESASGRFKRAWEGMRAELALLGDPFLEVASTFVKVTSAILKFINGMPGWAKKALVFGAIFAAIVGPVVMLIGLFANFAGSIGKFIASALRLVTTFEFLNKSQVATRLSAQLAESAFYKQATAAEALQAQLQGVVAAANASAQALASIPGVKMPPGLMTTPAPTDLGTKHGPFATNQQMIGMYANEIKPTLKGSYRGKTGFISHQDVANQQAMTRLAEQHMKASGLTALSSDRSADAQHREARARIASDKVAATTQKYTNGAAVSTAAMAGSMLLMAGTSNEVANNIGKWMMIGAIAVPAMQGLLPVIGAAASRFGDVTKATWNSAKGAAATGKGIKGTIGPMRMLGAAGKGAALGIASMLGPIGIATLAIGGTALAIYKLHKSAQDEIKKQIAQQKVLNQTTETWAEILGVAEKKRSELSLATYGGGPAGADSNRVLADKFKDSEAGKGLISAYDDADETEKATIALGQYIQILRETDGRAKDAQRGLEIMFLAAGEGALAAQTKAAELSRTVGGLDNSDMERLWAEQMMNVTSGVYDEAEVAGTEIGKILADAMADATSKTGMNDQLDNYASSVETAWVDLMGGLEDSSQDVLTNAGVTTGAKFRALIADWKNVVDGELSQTDFMENWNIDPNDKGAAVLLRQLDTMYAGTGGAADKLRETERGVVREIGRQIGMSKERLADMHTINDLTSSFEYRLKSVTKETARQLYLEQTAHLTKAQNLLASVGIHKKVGEEQKLEIMNQIRIALGLKEATSLTEGFKDEAKKAADETKKIKDNVNGIGRLSLGFTGEDAKSILQSGYAGVQSDLADMITDDFDRQMSQAADANTSHWDKAISNMEDAQERASERMENRHELESERFENRWERRKDAVEQAYADRIDRVEEAIEAEQKAEEIRQRIFEAEQTRLDRMTEAANRTIDFNMAMQTGDLDEAAKIRNDMDAAAQEWALSDGARKGATKSERRQERLQDRADALGERKDEVLERLEKREEAERKSLDKRQEQERKHLEKVQQMNMDALNAQAEASKKAFDEEWENRKESLDKQLETFKSFVPKNQKELKDWMKKMDIDYEKFGLDVLQPKSKKWGNFFDKSLRENMREASLSIGSSNMWEAMGSKAAKATLRGMGFGSMKKFEKFVMTGKLPKDFGEVRTTKGGKNKGTGTRAENTGMGPQTLHSGGVVGGATNNRTGVARNLKGLHSSEQMVRAQKGEFMVNKDSAKRFGPHLEAINKGVFDPAGTRNTSNNILGGAGLSMGSLISGALSRAFSMGIANAFGNVYQDKLATMSTGSFGTIGAGAYGGTAFNAEQLKNASIIANVGKQLGASSRDIVIALMTAMQESTLRNLSYGDRDSVGLFQQRDAWGSFEARTNPRQAAHMFFTGGAQGQRGLFDFPDRNNMSLAQAAQAVQVSAYPDAYAKWAEEAQAIFSALKSSGVSSGEFIQGMGGRHLPLDRPWETSLRIHGSPAAVDLAIPTGRNVYSVADGRVTKSTDIKGEEPRADHGGLGYKSYGRYIVVSHDNGASTLYAHLSKRFAVAGQRVKGGAVIGASGDTGYSLGPHLHFGASNGPLAWLKSGGQTLNDGIAMLHRGETVLTKPLTEDLNNTVRAFGKVSRDAISGRAKKAGGMWGPETTKVDKSTETGFWTWISGWTNKIKKALSVATPEKGAGGSVRTGTYNLNNNAGERTRNELTNLMSKADILGLTDVPGNNKGLSAWLGGKGWGAHGTKGDSMVAWNKALYSAGNKGSMALNTKNPGFRKAYANYAMLRGASGPLWAMAAHTSAHTGDAGARGARATAAQTEQFANLSRLTNSLKGGPVILMGDFNEDLRHDKIDIKGMRSNWIGNMKKGKGTLGNRFVDHILTSAGIRLVGTQLVKGMGSNHNAALAQYNIPGLSKGAMNIDVGGLARLHKDEGVLTKDINAKFKQGVDNFASGPSNEYNVNVYVTEPNASADEIATKVIGTLKKIESRKPQRRRS